VFLHAVLYRQYVVWNRHVYPLHALPDYDDRRIDELSLDGAFGQATK
jgi:hypothetical protein